MSLKVHGNPTREELRDTEVSVPSGMCHCKPPCGFLAIYFSDAGTPDAVLQTILKQVQEVTLKQEVNLSRNVLLSLTQEFFHPDEVTDLGDTISSPFSLSSACLAGWWVSGWRGCRHRARGHLYPVLPRALEQGSKSLPSPVMLPDDTGHLQGLRKTTNYDAPMHFKCCRSGEPGRGERSLDGSQRLGILT